VRVSPTTTLMAAPTPSASERRPEAVKGHTSLRGHAIVVAAVFVTTRLMLGAIVSLGLTTMHLRMPSFARTHGASPLIDGLTPWDGPRYAHIVTQGLHLIDTVYFPGYPLLVKAVSLVVSNVWIAGVLTANGCFLVALGYVYALALREFDAATARRTIIFLAIVPGTIFFSAMYTESLYIACGAAALYYARERRWLYAGLAGFGAAATRNTGFLFALAIAVEGLSGTRGWSAAGEVRWRETTAVRSVASRAYRARGALAAALLAISSAVAYVVFLSVAFRDPLASIHAEETQFHKHISLLRLLHPIASNPSLLAGAFDTASAGVFALLSLGVVLTMPLSFGIVTVPALLLPLSTAGTAGMTRYALMLLPCFLLLGRWTRSRVVNAVLLSSFLPLAIFVALVVSHWGSIT